MPIRPHVRIGLLQCSKCSLSSPFRSIHVTARKLSEEPQRTPSRRQAARAARNIDIDNLPSGVYRKSYNSYPENTTRVRSAQHSASQFGRSSTPRPLERPSSEIDDQRTALPARPARGGQQASGKRSTTSGSSGPGKRRGLSRRDPEQSQAGSGADVPNEDDDFMTEVLKMEEDSQTTMEKLIDKYEEAFAMPEEAYNYGQVTDLLTVYGKLKSYRTSLEAYKESPRAFGGSLSEKKIQDIEDMLKDQESKYDELIAQALQSIIKTDAKYLPYHVPLDGPPLPAIEKGQIGATPIGEGGMGNMTEDALRLLAGRPTMEWNDPKVLAQKLLDGKFVKFRTALEKNSVTRLAEEMQWQPDQTYKTENVGFRQPDDRTKRALVETVVKGEYKDPNDTRVKGEFLQNVARLAQFNGTYKAADKQTLLRTLEEMMPKQRATS